MKQTIRKLIADALEKAREAGELNLNGLPDIVVEEPKDKKMGDFSTTIAMVLAKIEKKNPRTIAEAIAGHLKTAEGDLAGVEIAGPGFINLKMAPSFYLRGLPEVAERGLSFGDSSLGQNQKVLLEFVSANPTGPLHVGHGRGAAVGDMLGALLKKAGYEVFKEYYVNDVGNQMNTLGRSTWLRYQELYGRNIDFPDDHYQGEYIKDVARSVQEEKGDSLLDQAEEEVLPYFREFSGRFILNGIKEHLGAFHVEFDSWFMEQSLYEGDSVSRIIDGLKDKGYVYEKDGAVWLKTADFSDEKDRVVVKKSGERTYFCSDIAYHQNKIRRGFDKIINIWGADHHGYVARMQAVVETLGFDLENFHTLLVQFVALKRGGEKVAMSTRSGEFITLDEVVREVGVDATRFFFLMRSSDSHLDFDLDLAKKETPENPVFYIQYAHARICSIFRTAEEQGFALPEVSKIELSLIKENEELDLVKKILAYPETIQKSAQALEVHRVSHYLQELVGQFHSYYNKHRIVTDDRELTLARLFLVNCLRTTIRSGLGLLGVSTPEKM